LEFAVLPPFGGQVKERLTGAIILVALMVLLVPELLTGPLRSTQRAAALPRAAGEAPLRSYTIELADEARTHNAAPQASGPRQPAPVGAGAQSDGAQAVPEPSGVGVIADPASEAASAPPSPGSAPAGPSAPSPSRAANAPTSPARVNRVDSKRANGTTSTPAAESGASAGAWVVQLGSFASRANAEHLAQQVRSQGFEVSVSQSSSGRHLFRVRVGAAKTQAGALALEQKLRALGHGGGTVLPKQGGA
jgi:cell division septation protein DedD